jgi:hypothetical protein
MSTLDNYAKKAEEIVLRGESDKYLGKLQEVANHPDNLLKITKVLSQIDNSTAMNGFRKAWNKLPRLAQWAVMRMGTPGNVFSSHGPFHMLIKFGFIEYKGHLNENGQINDEKIQAMGGMEKYLLKYGVKFGKYFFPELAPIEPYIDPLIKLSTIQDNWLTKIRHNLREVRQQNTLPQRNIHRISKGTKKEISHLHILPGYVETKAANTNAQEGAKVLALRPRSTQPAKRKAA